MPAGVKKTQLNRKDAKGVSLGGAPRPPIPLPASPEWVPPFGRLLVRQASLPLLLPPLRLRASPFSADRMGGVSFAEQRQRDCKIEGRPAESIQ